MSDKYSRFFENTKKIKFSKALMKPRVVQSWNEHNYENKKKTLGEELYEYYCLGLHKNMNR